MSRVYFSLSTVFILLSLVKGSTTPTQVHIALAGADSNGNSNSMAVSWQTEENTATSVVYYGTQPGDYQDVSQGKSSSYYETFHHHVVIGPLTPDTTYYYKVGDGDGGYSQEFKFRSAPLSSKNMNLTFAVFADLGLNNGDATVNFLKSIQDEVALIWHGGDVSYADDSFLHVGCATKFCYEQVWDDYMNEIEPIASALPYMTAVGNHEVECHDPACLADSEKRDKLSNFSAYNTRFRMPSSESGSGALNMHFSFNYGPVHFISIDTETGYPGAAEETRYVLPCGGFEEQLGWLEDDLKKANEERDVRPWVFVQGHHPMYQGNSINKEFQAAMEDLFYTYGVDVYFSGHVHSYERDVPVYNGVIDPNGYNNPAATTYLMIGGAGNDEMHGAQVSAAAASGATTVPSKPVVPGSSVPTEGQGKWRASTKNGAWTAVTDHDYFGIGKVTIMDESTLVFDYFRTGTGELHDSVTLKRDHSALTRKFKKH